MTQKRPSTLREAYLASASVPSQPPVEAREQLPMPIVPSQRWAVEGKKKLSKTFCFDDLSQRNAFVTMLLAFEEQCGHNAELTVSEGEVAVRVWTKSAGALTELDKEYARAADAIHKDVTCPLPTVYLGFTVG